MELQSAQLMISHAQPALCLSKVKTLLPLHCHSSLLKAAEAFPNPDSLSMWRTCSDTLGNQDWILNRVCVCVSGVGWFTAEKMNMRTGGVMPPRSSEGLLIRGDFDLHIFRTWATVCVDGDFILLCWSSTGLFTWTAVLDCSSSHEEESIELV